MTADLAFVFSVVLPVGVWCGVLAYWARTRRNARRCVNEVATALGGSVKLHIDGSKKEQHVIGERGGRQVRLIVGGFHSGEMEMKIRASRPSLSLRYDRNAKAKALNQLNADDWSATEDQAYFLSPHVYFEGLGRDSLREAARSWKQLPEELTTGIVQQMEAKNVESLRTGTGTITIQLNDGALMGRAGATVALQVMDLAATLATAIEATNK